MKDYTVTALEQKLRDERLATGADAERGRAAFRRLTRSHDRGTAPQQGGKR